MVGIWNLKYCLYIPDEDLVLIFAHFLGVCISSLNIEYR